MISSGVHRGVPLVLTAVVLAGCYCMGSTEDRLMWLEPGLWHAMATAADAQPEFIWAAFRDDANVTTPTLAANWGPHKLASVRWSAWNESPRERPHLYDYFELRGLEARSVHAHHRPQEVIVDEFREFATNVTCLPKPEIDALVGPYLASKFQLNYTGTEPQVYKVSLPHRTCLDETLARLEAAGALREVRDFRDGEVWLDGAGWSFHFVTGRSTFVEGDVTLQVWGDNRATIARPGAFFGSEGALRDAAAAMLAARGAPPPTFTDARYDPAEC